MDILIISPGADTLPLKNDNPEYVCAFSDDYARRFIKHLRNEPDVCTACGDGCVNCRRVLVKALPDRHIKQLYVPKLTGQFIDDPDEFLPSELPTHDMCLAINIHNDLLLELPSRIARVGGKALLVPVEAPDWLGEWTKRHLEKQCSENGLEFAAPKPFCGLNGEGTTHIKQFMDKQKIGRPSLELEIQDGIIKKADVMYSAPCGATYHIARMLSGAHFNDEIIQIACKALSSFPCTAGTNVDPEFNDSITHKANYIMIDVLKALLEGK